MTSFDSSAKAFDTVSHTILSKKLHNYDIRGLYTRSKMMNTADSVPQGSTSGPLFSLIYINDLKNALHSKPTLFADDTCLQITEDNPQGLRNKITVFYRPQDALSINCSDSFFFHI